MSHKLVSSILAILFLISIRLIDNAFRYLFAGMLAYAIILLFYNLWYLKKEDRYSFWLWIRPIISLGSVLGLFFILPDGFFKGLFLIFGTIFLYFSELTIAASAEQVVFIDTLISYFGLSMGLFAQNFYFPQRNYLVLVGIALITYIITRGSLDYIPQSEAKKNLFSMILALSMLELAWVLLFLPLHFTALGIFLFNCFYVLWILTYYYLFNNLNRKKISFHIFFSFVLIFVSFIATPWK